MQAKLREQRGKKKKPATGAAGAKAAGKRRTAELHEHSLETRARMFDEADCAREVAAAKALYHIC